MKKTILLLTILPFLSFFTACDNVDEKDRYIEVEDRPLSRKVLLEEFTGQNCVNCPEAHAVIEKLEQQFGEELIVVSIHAGSFGISEKNAGLMQEEGNTYAAKFNVDSYPSGVVDEKGGATKYQDWSANIRKDGYYPATMELDLKASLSSDGKKIDITTNLTSDNNVKGNLQLWVVENGIVGYQRDGNDRRYDYVHNNVFRGCVNGLWGEEFEITNSESQNFFNTVEVQADQKYEINNWNVDNLYIVGFVYNDSGVLVVNRAKVD